MADETKQQQAQREQQGQSAREQRIAGNQSQQDQGEQSPKDRFKSVLGIDPSNLSDDDLGRIASIVEEADKLRPLAGAGTATRFDAFRKGETPPEQARTVPDN